MDIFKTINERNKRMPNPQWSKWYLYVILFYVCVVLGQYVDSIFLYGALIVCFLEIMHCDAEYNFYFSVFLMPNIRILDGIGVLFLVNLVMVLPLIKHIAINGGIRRDVFLAAAVLFLMEVCHILLLGNYGDLTSTICWVLAFIYCMTTVLSEHITNEGIFIALSSSVIISAIAYCACNLEYTSVLLFAIFNDQRFGAYAGDPNYYALYICIAISLGFVTSDAMKRHYIVTIILIALVILTSSKTGLVLFAFILICAVCIKGFKKDSTGHFTRKVTLLLSSIALVLYNYIILFAKNMINRLMGKDGSISLSTITTGRYDIAMGYFDILMHDGAILLFGAGFSYHLYLDPNMSAHNTYLDIILSWGLVGCAVFICIIFELSRLFFLKWGKEPSLIYKLPMLTLLLGCISLSCFNATAFWWLIVIVMSAMKRV